MDALEMFTDANKRMEELHQRFTASAYVRFADYLKAYPHERVEMKEIEKQRLEAHEKLETELNE